jgi:PIN domain nuclease of toxin-antitoxin system
MRITTHGLGKLPLPQPPEAYLPAARTRHGIASLPLEETGVAMLASLPLIHRDPCDRMLVCQAKHHGLHVATVDPILRQYPIDLL